MIGSSDGTQYEDHFDRMINNPIPQEPETPKESGTKVAANVVKGNLSQMDVQIEADPVMLRVSNPPDKTPPGNDRMPAGAIKGSTPILPSQFKIDTSYDVKSGAVAGKDNNTVYIDPSIPDHFHPYLAVHEETEKHLMAGGMDYDRAHTFATLAEKHAVESAGISWNHYTDSLDPHVAAAEAKKDDGKGPPDPHVNMEDAIGHHADKAATLEKDDKAIAFDNFDKVPGKGNSGDRYSTKGFNVGGDPYERWDANQGTRFDHFQMLNKLVNNKAFRAWADALPENTDGNVEDRRLTDKTLQGYKQLVKDADNMGLSQDVRDHAFIERRGQFGGVHGNVGAPLPTPDPRRSGGGDLSAAARDKISASAKPVRMMDEELRKQGKVAPQLADQVGGPGRSQPSTFAPNNNNASYTWTAKEHETFLRMKSEGASNAEIAKELGKTRNAVIGRTNRLGLSDPNDPRAVGRKVNQQREEGITPEETPRNKPSLPRLKFLERPEIPE